MEYTKKEREYYNQDRARTIERFNIELKDYNFLRLQANKLRQLFVENCNGTITEKEYFAQVDKLENKIIERLKACKIENYYIQSDPRGATLYVSNNETLNASNYTNGICIY